MGKYFKEGARVCDTDHCTAVFVPMPDVVGYPV